MTQSMTVLYLLSGEVMHDIWQGVAAVENKADGSLMLLGLDKLDEPFVVATYPAGTWLVCGAVDSLVETTAV